MTIIDDTRYFPISSLPPLPPSDGTADDDDHQQKSKKKSKKNDDDVIVEEDYETLATQILENCVDEYENTNSGNLSDTLYIGRLGILVYLRIKLATGGSSSIINDTERKSSLLSKAKSEAESILQRAKKSCSNSGRRFRVSLLEGPYVGAICMLVHILTFSGDSQGSRQYANELVSQLSNVCGSMDASECEVLYGRAGALQGIFYIRQVLNDTTFASDFVVNMATHILQVGLRTSQEYFTKASAKKYAAIPLLWMWHDTAYLGAAHGVVGILHTLLYLTSQEWQQVERSRGLEGIQGKVQQSIDKMISSPYYIYEGTGNFKSSLKLERRQHHHHGHEERDRLVHWCHGAPGLCMLLLRASQVYPQKQQIYMNQAIQLAESVIYPRGVLQKGVGLCHGISGNAYIFLSLSRYLSHHPQNSEKASAAAVAASSSMSSSSSLIWIQRAEQYATFAIRNLSMLQFVPDCPYSLYEGLGGFVSLLLDLATLKRRKATGEEKFTSPPPSPPPMFPLYEFNL